MSLSHDKNSPQSVGNIAELQIQAAFSPRSRGDGVVQAFPNNWKLITDLPVESHADAGGKLHWYAMRWKIEVFHKILKSGCRAEEARLRTAERLVRLLAVFCILSWRVFWSTMLNRVKPDLQASLVLTELETSTLDRLITDPTAHSLSAGTLSRYLIKIARLGGYLARAKDPRQATSSCGAASVD